MTDRIVVLTGAASGIGYATAEKFLADGDTVVGLDVSDTTPQGVDYRRVDVSNSAEVSSAFTAIGEQYGRIDVLLNVAGINQIGRYETIPEAEWDRVVDVDLKGPFLVMQAALPWIRKCTGNIVNVASIAGIRGQGYTTAYSAAKGGLVALTRSLALELANEGIRVNCVCPGMVKTPLVQDVASKMTFDVDRRAMDRMIMLLPHGSLEPSEVADALFYLAGAKSVTGVALPLDGGMNA